MRCLFCKGLVTLDEKIAYLMNTNYIHERKIWIADSLMSRHKISWMVYAVEWGCPGEVFHQQTNAQFLTREGIRQHFIKRCISRNIPWLHWSLLKMFEFIILFLFIFLHFLRYNVCVFWTTLNKEQWVTLSSK